MDTLFTDAQMGWIDWAIDAMDDPEMYPDGPIESLEHAWTVEGAIDDLLYRLEQQTQDLWDDRQPDQMTGSIQSARNAAAKIRRAQR